MFIIIDIIQCKKKQTKKTKQ